VLQESTALSGFDAAAQLSNAPCASSGCLDTAIRPDLPAAAEGLLTGDEINEVKRNRAWRNLVERKISNPAQPALIMADLWIPK